MLNGPTEKSEKVITSYYRKFDSDSSFSEHADVARRFQHTFDIIDDHFGSMMSSTFRKRTLFYALYGAVYSLLYGFGNGSQLSPKRGKSASALLSAADARAIGKAGEKIAAETAPESIIQINKKATQHARERAAIIKYLLKYTTG